MFPKLPLLGRGSTAGLGSAGPFWRWESHGGGVLLSTAFHHIAQGASALGGVWVGGLHPGEQAEVLGVQVGSQELMCLRPMRSHLTLTHPASFTSTHTCHPKCTFPQQPRIHTLGMCWRKCPPHWPPTGPAHMPAFGDSFCRSANTF